MFQQSKKEWPPRNITLKSLDEVWVTTLGYDGESRRIRLAVSTSGVFRKLLKALLDEKQPYNPRIYIKSWNVRQGMLYVRGQLQVAIPYSFYVAHATRYRRNHGSLCAGVDVNTDRINLAIVEDLIRPPYLHYRGTCSVRVSGVCHARRPISRLSRHGPFAVGDPRVLKLSTRGQQRYFMLKRWPSAPAWVLHLSAYPSSPHPAAITSGDGA